MVIVVNADKLKEMTDIEIGTEILKLKNELFNLRFQHATGQLENPVRMRIIKKDIARAKTILREMELKKVNA